MGIFDFFKSNNNEPRGKYLTSEHSLNHLLVTQKNKIFEALKAGGMNEDLITQIKIYEGKQADNFLNIFEENEYIGQDGRCEKTYKGLNEAFGQRSLFSLQKKGHDTPFYFYFGDSTWNYIFYPGGGNYGITSLIYRFPDSLLGKRIFPKKEYLDYDRFAGDFLPHIKIWSKNVVKQFNTADFWEELIKIQRSFNFENISDNYEDINNEEATIIEKKLHLLETELCKQYGNTNELQQIIHHEFQRIRNAIKEMDKKTWVQFFIGVLASLALTLGVSAANNDLFWGLIKNVFGSPFRFLLLK